MQSRFLRCYWSHTNSKKVSVCILPERTSLSVPSVPELFCDSNTVHVSLQLKCPLRGFWDFRKKYQRHVTDKTQDTTLLSEFPSLWRQTADSSSRPVGLCTARSIIHFCLLSWLQPGCSFSSQHARVIYEETSSRCLLVVRLRHAWPDIPSCPYCKDQSLVLLGSGRLQSSDWVCTCLFVWH